MAEIRGILDKVDKKILAELDKNCRISSTQLARKVGKSRQAVEYRINQLVEKGIIAGFQASINPHKIGHKIYKIYLKLRNIPQEKEKLFSYLKSAGNVYWIGECSGNWDLIFGVFCKSDYDFFNFKNELISNFNKIILEEYGDSLIDVRQYPKMYFNAKIEEPTMFAGEIVNNNLDKIDYSILEQVVKNGRVSLTELARIVNSTETICKGRLRKLQEKGIIIQYRLGINLNNLNLELYKTIIKLDKYTKEDEKKFLNYVSNLPNIHYLIRNIWGIELELVVSNYQEYYLLIENLKKEFPFLIKSVESLLMITDEWTPGFGDLLK